MTLPPAFVARVRVQPNSYTCGPVALRHALLWHGVPVSVQRIARAARVTKKHGADEHKLARAAEKLGFRLRHIQRQDCAPIVCLLVRSLAAKKIPVLVCVDRNEDGPWQHWITVVHATARAVTICDSARPGPVVRTITWREFLGRACAWYPGAARFDLYPVVRA